MPLAALAGTAVMVSTLAGMDPVVTWSLAIIAGGGTATAIKGAAAGSRLASSLGTGGIANPLVSTVETAAASTISLAAILAPVLAANLSVVTLPQDEDMAGPHERLSGLDLGERGHEGQVTWDGAAQRFKALNRFAVCGLGFAILAQPLINLADSPLGPAVGRRPRRGGFRNSGDFRRRPRD